MPTPLTASQSSVERRRATLPWPARLATCALFACNGLGFGAWISLLPRLREVAGLNDAALGVVLLALSVGAMLAMPVVGRVAARVGAGPTCLVAGLALLVVLPLPGLVRGYVLLLVVVTFLGVALGTLDVGMNAHASRVERHWGSAIMSSFHGVWSAAGFGGAALMGLLLSRGYDLPACFGVAAAGCGVLALAALACGRGIPAEAAPALPRQRFSLPARALLGVSAMAALSFIMEGAISDWSGVYLHVVLRASAARATIAYQGFALAMAVCRFGGDFVVRRLGPVAVLRLGGLLAAVGVGLGLAMRDAAAAAASFALAGIGLANVVPVVFSAAGRRGPQRVATVATVGYAGLLGGPPLLGFVAQHAGLGAALALVPVGALALIAIAPSIK